MTTWTVHNDYDLVGVKHTFWLFTHFSGIWAKGEGLTDEEACLEALVQAEARRDQYGIARGAE